MEEADRRRRVDFESDVFPRAFDFRPTYELATRGKVGALKRSTEVIEFREGGDPNLIRRMPGHTRYAPITLERGLTHDLEFERWANLVWQIGAGLGSEAALKSYRKDLVLEVMNEAGQVAIAYRIYRAWVSEYQALPELDANSNAVAIETLTLQHEGFERDEAVTEPVEPE